MASISARFLVALILLSVSDMVESMISRGRPGHGFIGYGITMYYPPCAWACQNSISNPLHCDNNGEMDMTGMNKRMEMSMAEPSPECYATNDPYLQTLAYCMSQHCQDIDIWELERWWQTFVPGRNLHQPVPKEPYQQALESLQSPPNSTIPADEVLHSASLVSADDYEANYNGDHTFEINDTRHETYG